MNDFMTLPKRWVEVLVAWAIDHNIAYKTQRETATTIDLWLEKYPQEIV